MAKAPQSETQTKPPKAKRTRKVRQFPASSFDEPYEFAKQVYEFGSGQSVRRLSLFDHLDKSPDSSASRMAITNANKYGLIKGNYAADQLELTETGKIAVSETSSPREQTKATIKLAIDSIEPFKGLYDRFVGNKLPAKAALTDVAKELGVSDDTAEEAVDTFIVNMRTVGLLKTLSGAERIVSIDHVMDSLPQQTSRPSQPAGPVKGQSIVTSEHAKFESTAFYITPIGADGSEQRMHSDLFFGSIVEPALEPFKLTLVRADMIDQPGVITRQIIDYLFKSRLVIVDLSFHNPNVFYELAIRHMLRKPVVQVMRSSDHVPFDVNQVRTIMIDTTNIYSLVPKIETYRAEISNQVRRAMDNPDAIDNPISINFPNFHVTENG